MDKQGEYVADIDRYAFLLGSALKNCDDEQFFCIYDSIIPADLPLSQPKFFWKRVDCVQAAETDGNFREGWRKTRKSVVEHVRDGEGKAARERRWAPPSPCWPKKSEVSKAWLPYDQKVEWIKEKARYISELPDDDFNELVVNARDFSLARGRPHPPSSSTAMSTNGQRLVDDPSDDDVDSGRLSRSSRVPQLHFRTRNNPLSTISNGAGMTDDDSGLPSSTKSGQRLSLSSSDDQAEMEEKGCSLFDKIPDKSKVRTSENWESGDQRVAEGEPVTMPPRLRVGESVVVSHSYKPHYDEEIPVEHDNESVESPRSDASSTREYDLLNPLEADDLPGGMLGRQCGASDGSVIVDLGAGEGDQEMKVIKQEWRPYHDVDDDDDSDGGDIHRKLYGRHASWYVDRPRASSTSSIGFHHSSSILAREQPISSLRRSGGTSVDDSVHFPSLSGGAAGATFSHTQSRYSPDCISALSPPPFGTDKPQLLDRVGESIRCLVQTPSYNMSQMASEGGAAGDGKKKKKKKKDIKDESTREGGSRGKSLMTTDVNGNPTIDQNLYRGMREPPPRPHESISPVSGSRGRGTAANHDYSSGRGDLQEMGNKSDDPTSPTGSTGNNGQQRKRKGSKKASNPGKDIKPEDDPNYVGNIKDIDSLVKFINSTDINPEKLRKNNKAPEDGGGNRTPAASATTPLGKTVKKLKDRSSIKSKQLLTVGVGENTEDSLTPASETTQLLSSATSFTSSYSSTCERVSCEQASECKDLQASRSQGEQKVAKEMGNSATSKLSGGDDEEVTPPQEISDSVKNHKIQEQSISTALPPKSAGDTGKTLTNNKLFNSSKLTSTLKKDQTGETKESSKENKGKSKGGNKDNTKNDGSVTCADNNNKKNKTKPSKNDVKGDSKAEKVSPTESKKDAKVEAKDPTPAVPSNELDIHNNMSNDYIFTDVDIPNVEPEFTTVVAKSKKKKRPQGERSGNSSFQSVSQHHYSSKEAQTFPSHQPSFVPCSRAALSQISSPPPYQHPQTHHPHSKRSFTPPPLHAIRDNNSVGGNNSDLSLNAFPKLSSDHSGPRRRSMENLYENINSFDKDSDKESTKSLPADKGVGGRSNGGASCFPVSFASMVSIKTPRQSVDSSKAESVSSSMEDANMEEFPTPSTTSMKWKGSPQERRHSIGSAPEEFSKTSGNSSSLQRSGSQEVLSRDSDSLDMSSTVTNTGGVPEAVTGMTQSDSACSFAGSDADSARGSEAGFETPGEVFANHNCASSVTSTEEKKTVVVEEKNPKPAVSKTNTIPVGSVSRAPSQTVNSTISGGSSGSNSNTSTTAAAAGVKSKVTQQSGYSSRSQAMPTIAVSTSKPNVTVKMTPLVTKPVNNGHKNKNCVVFCNTNQRDTFTVDVSFGGDPLFSLDGQLESSASLSTTPSSGGSNSVSSIPSTAKDKVCSTRVTTPSSQLPAKTSAAASSSSSSDINSVNKPLKGPHIAGLNGLVSPRPTDIQPVVVLQTSTVPTTTSSSPAQTQQGQTVSQAGSPSVNFEGQSGSSGTGVVDPVVKTENVPLPNADNDGVNISVPKGGVAFAIGTKIQAKKPQFKIFIQPEPAAIPSSQARMEVVTFFTKGWMKVETELKNDAGSLRVYSSQD